jgi:uncharacterized protein (TIGR02246 family)
MSFQSDLTTGVQPIAENEKEKLRKLLQQMERAFSSKEGRLFGDTFADDARAISPVGQVARGRAQIAQMINDEISRFEVEGGRFQLDAVRQIAADLAFVDCTHDVQGKRLPTGERSMQIHLALLAKKVGADWQWLEARAHPYMQAEGSQRSNQPS